MPGIIASHFYNITDPIATAPRLRLAHFPTLDRGQRWRTYIRCHRGRQLGSSATSLSGEGAAENEPREDHCGDC